MCIAECVNVSAVQLTDRVKMHFDPSLCPASLSEGLAMNSKYPYPFGVDPTWKGTRTELQFLNSVKMKISILLGAQSKAISVFISATCPLCPLSEAAEQLSAGFPELLIFPSKKARAKKARAKKALIHAFFCTSRNVACDEENCLLRTTHFG